MRGVFWIIENRPAGCNKTYNYYPRGRIDYNGKGKPVLYMNQNVSIDYVPDILNAFELEEEAVIRIDRSRHYRCYLDEGYKIDK